MTASFIASFAFGAWIYLLLGRGGFWRAAQRDTDTATNAKGSIEWPRVVAVIPARDEAAVIGDTVSSLLRQDYRGEFHVFVVDDHSSDQTTALARRAAASAGATERVTVLPAPQLREGWTGKVSALNHGIEHAISLSDPPEYLLLTDADIRHAVDNLTELVVRMRRDRLVLASLMAKLHCKSLAERALMPAFVFFFQMLYPFAWVNSSRRTTAAAAGGCMLVHRQSLQRAGGIVAIRGDLIDDCALARLMKKQGPIGLALSERVHSARVYPSFSAIRDMIVRSAFAELRFSFWRLAATTTAMLIVFVSPPLIVAFGAGTAQLLAAFAWIGMAASFQPVLRFYRLPVWWGLALPAIALCYTYLTLDSAFQHLRGRGGEWKGRVQGRRVASDSMSRTRTS